MGAIELNDVEIDEMVAQQRKNDPRIKSGEIKITPYAVRCMRHGRRVLSMDEVGGGTWGWFGSVDLYKDFKCPECGATYKLDWYWHDHTKSLFSTL